MGNNPGIFVQWQNILLINNFIGIVQYEIYVLLSNPTRATAKKAMRVGAGLTEAAVVLLIVPLPLVFVFAARLMFEGEADRVLSDEISSNHNNILVWVGCTGAVTLLVFMMLVGACCWPWFPNCSNPDPCPDCEKASQLPTQILPRIAA